jgi:probable phosphoglycerate mutase
VFCWIKADHASNLLRNRTPRELAARIKEFVEGIMKSDDDALVVTHGFAPTFVMAAFQNIEIDSMGYISHRFALSSITILEDDDFL